MPRRSRAVIALGSLGLMLGCHPARPTAMPRPSLLTARSHPTLHARIVACEPLIYTDEAPGELDRPVHVRAASGIARFDGGLAIVQDDASFVALRMDDRTVRAIALPAGEGGRRRFEEALGNKQHKLDLEAVIALDDRIVAFGSGSTPARERIAIVDVRSAEGRLFDASALYARLRETRAFSGAELNVEGAVVLERVVRLFQRGNGAARDGYDPIDASVDLDREELAAWLRGEGPVPSLGAIHRYDLGRVDGVPFSFTDATALPDGRILFAAGAEDSPDTYRDGAVLGTRIGLIDRDEVWLAPLLGADGAPSLAKLEGLTLSAEGLPHALGVTDVDDPEVPASLCALRIEGLGVGRSGG